MPPHRVLLVADEYYASLAAVRGLRLGGFEPWVGATTPDGYAHRSRAAAGVAPLPDPHEDTARFTEEAAALAQRLGAVATLPGHEAAAVALAGDALDAVTDKAALARLAAEAGLETPPAEIVRGEPHADLSYPAIVKPVRSADLRGEATGAPPDSVRVGTRDELARHLARHPDVRFLVQPFLAGRLTATAGVAWDGVLHGVVHQAARRIFPRDCGVSAYAETIPPDRALEERLRGLLAEIGYRGIWEAQFLEADGARWLIDLNPRMYGSLALALAAGSNLPAIWVELLLGRRPRDRDYRVGVHYRAEMRDLGVLSSALAARDLRTAVAVLVPRPRTAHAVFALGDPRPSLLLLRRMAARSRDYASAASSTSR